jgi:hypothetical protein
LDEMVVDRTQEATVWQRQIWNSALYPHWDSPYLVFMPPNQLESIPQLHRQ